MRPHQPGIQRAAQGFPVLMPRFLPAAAAVLSLFIGGAAESRAASDRDGLPLPEAHAFLEEVRRNIRSDDALLDQYTFTEKRTEKRLDADGRVKKIKSETFEVYPSAEPGQMYRRLIARDDVPLSASELAAEDRKQQERTALSEKTRAGEDEAARERRRRKEELERRQENAVIDELFRMDDLVVEGRETLNGRPTIVLSFAPKPGYKPVTTGGKVIQKLAGRAWIDEQDRQIARVEARLLDSLGVGPARLARLQKGAVSYFYRRKVNGEIWLPAEARFTGAAKVLWLFGARVDALFQYSDYKKFSVSTDSEVNTSQ